MAIGTVPQLPPPPPRVAVADFGHFVGVAEPSLCEFGWGGSGVVAEEGRLPPGDLDQEGASRRYRLAGTKAQPDHVNRHEFCPLLLWVANP